MQIGLTYLLFVSVAAASWVHRQEVPFTDVTDQLVDRVQETWPGKKLLINSEAGERDDREAWTAELRSLAALRELELISLSEACSSRGDRFPDGPCYFPGPGDHVAIHFLRFTVVDAELRLDFRVYVQGDPAAGLIVADRRALFQANSEGAWMLRQVLG